MNFRISFFISAKNAFAILTENMLNLYIALGSIVILTKLSLPVQEPRTSFYLFRSSLISFSNVLQFSVYKSFVLVKGFLL